MKRLIIILVIILLLIFAGVFYLFVYKKSSPKNYQPKPGSCLILEEKYCSKGKFIINAQYPNQLRVGFKLPKNTPIFFPSDGLFTKSSFVFGDGPNKKSSFGGTVEILRGDMVYYYQIITDLNRDDRAKSKNVKQGEILASVNETKIDYFGDYNLVFNVSIYDRLKKEYITNKNQMEKIFNSIKN